MVRVMIVDDEMLVRVGLKASIDWQKYGFVVAHEAGNGRDALDKIREGAVDVVLLDIKMPIMDGIELLNRIREEKLVVKVIILSCHDDFEYVKETMRLGAEDYILKFSLNTDKLISILLDLKDHLQMQNSIPAEYGHNLLKKYWYSLLDKFDRELWLAMKKAGMKLNEGSIVVLHVLIDDYEKQTQTGIIKSPELTARYIASIIADVIRSYANGDCHEKSPSEYIAIVNPGIQKKSTIEDIAANMKDAIKRFTQITVSIGISSVLEDVSQISEGCMQAEKALDMKFLNGRGAICSYEAVTPQNYDDDCSIIFTIDMEQKLKNALEYHDTDNVLEIVNNFFKEVKEKSCVGKEIVMKNIDDMILVFSTNLKAMDKRFDSIEELKGININKHIRRFEYMEDLWEWIHWFISVYVGYISQIRSFNKQRKEIVKAIKYIEEKYAQNINLTEIAGHVNLSESYLSFLFKKETGDGLANYLTKYRLEEGRKLLLNTSMSICEIAEKTGYHTIYYFSSAFKKFYGVSPMAFKKNRKQRS